MTINTSKLSVKIENTSDPKRNFQVQKNERGWLSIGTAYDSTTTAHIHPDDIEQFLTIVNEVLKVKIPLEP